MNRSEDGYPTGRKRQFESANRSYEGSSVTGSTAAFPVPRPLVHVLLGIRMKNGPYELVVAPEDYPGKKYRGRYCYEHHLVWWQNTNNLPGDNDVIHHKNGNKRDNRFSNLEMLDRAEHTSHHNEDIGKRRVRLICPSCGDEFVRDRNKTHLVKATKATYCSRSCIGRKSNSKYAEVDQVVEEFVEYSIPR